MNSQSFIHDLPQVMLYVHNFPGLRIGLTKLQDFPQLVKLWNMMKRQIKKLANI